MSAPFSSQECLCLQASSLSIIHLNGAVVVFLFAWFNNPGVHFCVMVRNHGHAASKRCSQTRVGLRNLQKCEWKQETRNKLIFNLPVLFLFCFFFFLLLSLPGSTVGSLFLSDASFSVWRRLRRTTPSSWTRRALKVGLCSPQLLYSHRGNRSDCVISGSLRRPCLSTLCRYGLWLADWVNPCHYTHFSRVTFLSCRGDGRLYCVTWCRYFLLVTGSVV